jgi:hypothetical protein
MSPRDRCPYRINLRLPRPVAEELQRWADELRCPIQRLAASIIIEVIRDDAWEHGRELYVPPYPLVDVPLELEPA